MSTRGIQTLTIETPAGTAEAVLHRALRTSPVGLLVLGHGAGGDIDADDLVAVRDAALTAGMAVALVRQPYRVAGRRAPAPATSLDASWIASVERVRRAVRGRFALVVGGRSAGARVACRTARAVGAAGVLALAYPLHPPGKPESSRAGELDPTTPTLVINGDRDPFGVPRPIGLVEVVVRPGERHGLDRDPQSVARAALEWLMGMGWAAAPRNRAATPS